MISNRQDIPSCWDDTNSIDTNIDWENDLGFELMDLPTSEFLTSAAELEQTYGSVSSCASNGWGYNPASPKLQIRNHDCMWSGTCVDQSHPGKFGCGQEPVGSNKFSTVTAVAAASLNSNAAVMTQKSVLTPSNNSAININNNITAKGAAAASTLSKMPAAQIPAGRSLLINPRVKQSHQQQQHINRVPTVSTADFLRERESTIPLHNRPDTPLSLDEDPPEFKHNIDLATCTIGSNRLSLTGSSGAGSSSRHHSSHHHNNHFDDPSSSRIINMLKMQLEDTESGSLRTFMTGSTGEIGSLTDLLNDLEEMDGGDNGEEDEEEEEESNGEELDSDTDVESHPDSRSSCNDGGTSTGGDFSSSHHHHHQEARPSFSSSSASSSSSSSSSYEYQGTHVGDHSYTRPKNRYNPNELGVQTPSDSEEEIDVVSIGEKNLPTNPTARDRRALQSRVAHKIARKQAQQTPGSSSSGGSQHHHRRRHSDDEYRTGGGPSTSKAGAISHTPNYLTPAPSTSISGSNTPLPGGNSSSSNSFSSSSGSSSISNPRKRPNKDDHHRNGSTKNGGRLQHQHQQHRSKKQRLPPTSSTGGKKMPCAESSEEQDTLEKRNLHNDMERQRRIGLKNLFEELKRQIPNLRDKERAPKVNILREAATLCTRLSREQEQLNALRKQQQRLYARVRQLRTSLHTQRRVMD
ncbi:myc protein [Toxorhynchites rutilus septentrionalis]|uniref:myc protein n=1 Tax=Toxorhynchites rutilus septentrionalis TaxID=329112 RepID=UPI002479FEF4|nr:myc protein [Toxorhynchites rutilus septentrionalis]